MSGTVTGNAPTTRSGANGLAIAGLVCGVIGLFLFNFILGPLAVIFGGVGVRKASQGAGHRGMAWAGVVLGIIDVLIFVVLIALAASHHGHFYWHVG
ncbi:MAG TPA: DUF4190 domain-containing protein [Streptosporangiaceae bacterium]|nr:DUF4190 domain-containing protein [Streptosporangiaceae bacterium]